MVVFVDLEGDDDELQVAQGRLNELALVTREAGGPSSQTAGEHGLGHSVPQRNGFADAVGCYPVALSLASHLDLNDLFSLSLTSRRIHDNLVQFSHQLVSHSLRCVNASQPLLSDILSKRSNDSMLVRDMAQTNIYGAYTGAPAIVAALPGLLALEVQSRLSAQAAIDYRSISTSKISHCARDLVAECRRCGTIVCRNCTAKPPSDRCLPDRFRRLCRACLRAPVIKHLQPPDTMDEAVTADTPPSSSASSMRSTQSASSSTSTATPDNESTDVGRLSTTAFTSLAFLREPCTCVTRGVYLCNPCGQNLRALDTTYKRVWTWRSRYSTHIGGGLGTGLGEGDQGQKCGRGKRCLETGSSGVCWVEIDCQDQEKNKGETGRQESRLDSGRGNEGSFFTTLEQDTRSNPHTNIRNAPGYHQQEIEGIGGVVKKKVKKRVKVGATVWEFDDERESGRYLEREASGEVRSWCGWCSRLVPGADDRAVSELSS